MKPVILDEWAVVSSPDPYKAPEYQGPPRLHGKVSGHPRHDDGKWVTTSAIIGVDTDNNIQTMNTLYALGDPHPDYANAYPDAKARLIESVRRNTTRG